MRTRGIGLIPLRWAVALVAALLAAAVAVGVWATWFRDEESAGPERGVTVADVVEAPERYLGRRVAVSGEIAVALSETAFVLGGDGVADDDMLLVVGADVEALDEELRGEAFAVDDAVRVTGVVRRFQDELVEEIPEANLDAGLFRDFEGRPAVVADRVEPLRGGG